VVKVARVAWVVEVDEWAGWPVWFFFLNYFLKIKLNHLEGQRNSFLFPLTIIFNHMLSGE
jgi:hypothetical protein